MQPSIENTHNCDMCSLVRKRFVKINSTVSLPHVFFTSSLNRTTPKLQTYRQNSLECVCILYMFPASTNRCDSLPERMQSPSSASHQLCSLLGRIALWELWPLERTNSWVGKVNNIFCRCRGDSLTSYCPNSYGPMGVLQMPPVWLWF